MGVIRILMLFLRGALHNRTELAILQQKSKTPRLRQRDWIFGAMRSGI